MDIRKRKLVLWELVALGLVCMSYNYLFEEKTLLWLFMGGSIGIVMMLISLLSKEQIGYGDSILFIALGLGVGFAGCVWILLISMTLAFLFGGMVCLVKKKNMKYKIPFVPFVLIGTLMVRIF